jgi:opacity protein-like surface antigen
MRKICSIIGLLLIVASSGFSQRNYVGLSFGSSLPNEEFAAKSILEDGGYALPGFVVEFSGAYIFDYYIGIAGTFTFSSNSPDRSQLGEDLKAAVPGPIPPDTKVQLKMGNWLYSNLMAGPVITIPVWILNFDLRGVAGLSFLMSPPWELTVIAGQDEYFESRSGQNLNFAYMLGAGIRFNVRESYAIRLSADYFRSKPSFSVDENGLVGSITGKSNYEMSVGTVNLNLGIAYRF